MGVIHIEGIEERVMKAIELRATANGRNLEEEIRAILEAAVADEAARARDRNWLERLDEIRSMTKGYSPETDSTAIIREMRDRGYSNY
jgi:plasmid stability protein